MTSLQFKEIWNKAQFENKHLVKPKIRVKKQDDYIYWLYLVFISICKYKLLRINMLQYC